MTAFKAGVANIYQCLPIPTNRPVHTLHHNTHVIGYELKLMLNYALIIETETPPESFISCQLVISKSLLPLVTITLSVIFVLPQCYLGVAIILSAFQRTLGRNCTFCVAVTQVEASTNSCKISLHNMFNHYVTLNTFFTNNY